MLTIFQEVRSSVTVNFFPSAFSPWFCQTKSHIKSLWADASAKAHSRQWTKLSHCGPHHGCPDGQTAELCNLVSLLCALLPLWLHVTCEHCRSLPCGWGFCCLWSEPSRTQILEGEAQSSAGHRTISATCLHSLHCGVQLLFTRVSLPYHVGLCDQ